MEKYDALKLDNQLCFPLYVASKEVIRRYKPILEKYDLTYTQYIAMMVIWEENEIKVTDLGKRLYLDTGTISPLIRKLKDKGYIEILRDSTDERVQVIKLTETGNKLKEKAIDVPKEMMQQKCINLSMEDAVVLKKLLEKMINANE
jgi:DNA-binding MarR family transcriptional regulator